jgi:ATP-dependent protease ClpP protease subunit
MTTIQVFGEIGQEPLDKFVSQVRAATDPILLEINSQGGLVGPGFGMVAALAHRAVHVSILGLAASMASALAMLGRHVQMSSRGLFMIHNPWQTAAGDASEHRKIAETLDKHRDQLVEMYVAKSRKSRRQIQTWLDEETWFTADEARDAGFVDEVVDGSAVAVATAESVIRSAIPKFGPGMVAAMARRSPVLSVESLRAEFAKAARSDPRRANLLWSRLKKISSGPESATRT